MAKTLPLEPPYDIMPVGQWFSSKTVTLTVKQGQRVALFDLGGVADATRAGIAGGDTPTSKGTQTAAVDLAAARVLQFPIYNLYRFKIGLGFLYSTGDDKVYTVDKVTTGSGATAVTQQFIDQTRDPERLKRESEPHARGAILVAAVFGAFLAANKVRIEDLIRLATAGTGVLPAGAIHPDLVNRLAEQTSGTAKSFLNMCIRALDYCPPVDMTFGDYLRALVTADIDMVPNDHYGYRVALIESFRRWGILPHGLRTLSEEQLRWPFARLKDFDGWAALTDVAGKIRPMITETLYIRDRRTLFQKLRDARGFTHDYLEKVMADNEDAPHRPEFNRVTGLNIWRTSGLTGLETKENGIAYFEVHALRPALRVSPDGTIMKQLIMILTQQRRVPVDPDNPNLGTFPFRGGATLIFDLEGETPSLRYAITRPIDSDERLTEIRAYWRQKNEEGLSLRSTYFGTVNDDGTGLEEEPLALLHSEG